MPQIAQLTEDSWYLVSQLFWLLLVFGGIYLVIGRGMLPKVESTIDARDAKIASDLAAAKAAHARADELEATHNSATDAARAEAQKLVATAKSKSAADNEKKLAKVDAELNAKLAEAEASIKTAKSSALAEIENVAGDAARDLVAKLSGVKISAAEAAKAAKDALHA